METSGIYIFKWWQIAIVSGLFGFYTGWVIKNFIIFIKVSHEHFEKKLAKKENILYISKYKKKRE